MEEARLCGSSLDGALHCLHWRVGSKHHYRIFGTIHVPTTNSTLNWTVPELGCVRPDPPSHAPANSAS
eukprot:2754346-Pyramimonas_sp.AAC.1